MIEWLFLIQNVREVNLSITHDYLFPSLSVNVSMSSRNSSSKATVTSTFGFGLRQFERTAMYTKLEIPLKHDIVQVFC